MQIIKSICIITIAIAILGVPNTAVCNPPSCGFMEYCCNPSCGICSREGSGCTQQICPPTAADPTPVPTSDPTCVVSCRGNKESQACYRDTISCNADCMGDYSCHYATISGNANCFGADSCYRAKISGDAECFLDSSCNSATISGDAECIGAGTCRNAIILGNADCRGESSCVGAKISGNAQCGNNNACNNAIISGNAVCSDFWCMLHLCTSCWGTTICGTCTSSQCGNYNTVGCSNSAAQQTHQNIMEYSKLTRSKYLIITSIITSIITFTMIGVVIFCVYKKGNKQKIYGKVSDAETDVENELM